MQPIQQSPKHASSSEKKRLGGPDRLHRLPSPNAQIGFLHDIVDIPDGRKRGPQVGLQMIVVHMHFLPKPIGLIGRCRSALRRGSGADCSGRTHGAKSLVPIRYSSKHGKTSVEAALEK